MVAKERRMISLLGYLFCAPSKSVANILSCLMLAGFSVCDTSTRLNLAISSAPDIKSAPDTFAIDTMLAAMSGTMRSMLEARPSPATVRKHREQLVLLRQSYMAAAMAQR
jgi:hypothetical protein